VIPVVGECDDSWLSESRVVQVEADDAGRAVAAASGGALAEGAVGGGTGMMTKGYKAGIGTASRIAPSIGGAVGILVQANFSSPPGLVMAGVPVGDLLGEPRGTQHTKAGSCIAVVAVDAPPSRRISSSGSLAAQGSGSRGAAPSGTTEAARSSSPSLLRAGGHAARRPPRRSRTATSTTSSRPSSTRRRRQC
jgi:D-aminopeptidase